MYDHFVSIVMYIEHSNRTLANVNKLQRSNPIYIYITSFLSKLRTDCASTEKFSHKTLLYKGRGVELLYLVAFKVWNLSIKLFTDGLPTDISLAECLNKHLPHFHA